MDWIRRAKSLWNLNHPGVVRMSSPSSELPCTTRATPREDR